MLQEGEKAIEFILPDDQGNPINLKDFIGKKVVLYFYPKDSTPGCTTEACSFRDIYDDILAAGAVVIGISPDSSKSHTSFRNKQSLPFYLLSDIDHKVAEAYGVWGEKKMYGRTYMGILRTTFIIDESGTIIKVFPKVTPKDHGAKVLEILRSV